MFFLHEASSDEMCIVLKFGDWDSNVRVTFLKQHDTANTSQQVQAKNVKLHTIFSLNVINFN